MLRSIWRWRSLVKELARRELRARYAGSVLGGAWTVIEPAVQFALYFTVFSYFLGMRLEGRPGVGHYAIYLVSGLVPFQMFQECVMRSAGFARAQAGLVRHVSVPLEVLLTGSIAAVVARHLLSLALVFAAAAAAGTLAVAKLPALLVGLATLLAGTLGLALVLVPAGAYLPDLVQVVGTATTVLFFLTPIVYPVSAVPEAASRWIHLNPFEGVVAAFRGALVGGEVTASGLVAPAVVAAGLLLAGAAVFAHRSRAVRDVV